MRNKSLLFCHKRQLQDLGVRSQNTAHVPQVLAVRENLNGHGLAHSGVGHVEGASLRLLLGKAFEECLQAEAGFDGARTCSEHVLIK